MSGLQISPFHEKALRDLDIPANVEHIRPGVLIVQLSDDDLDRLVEAQGAYLELDDKLIKAESTAHDEGYSEGHDEGYNQACSDIASELGNAWDVVKPLLERAFEEGHQAACEEIEEMGT